MGAERLDAAVKTDAAFEERSTPDGPVPTSLEWLLFARLALCVVSFGIALALETVVAGAHDETDYGLYWTLATAFLATALSGISLRHVKRAQLAALVMLGIDVGIVSALVGFSGGYRSVFSFLYLAVTLYGAVLLGRRGAIFAATLSALAHGGVLVLHAREFFGPSVGATPIVLVSNWAVHASGLFLVAALASLLAGELRRTGAALDRRTHDLRRLHDLHRRTVASILSGLLTTDSEGRITSLNPEGERITGRTSHDVLGESADELIPGVLAIMNAEGRGEGAETNRRARLPYVNHAGQRLHLGLAASVLRESDGAPAGQILIFTDVSNVVAMEAQLRSSERLAAVGEMAAKMAHEIRNPLAAISGSVQILRRDLAPDRASEVSTSPGEPRQLMDIVVTEAERLSGLIEDFLGYAQPRPLRQQAVDVSSLCRDVAKLHEAVKPPGVEVSLSLSNDLRVRADADQLRQVVWNLVRNAFEALSEGGEGGTVELGARTVRRGTSQEAAESRRNAGRSRTAGAAANDWAEIFVRDTGPGIEETTLERLYEPFFTTKAGGTGLGLATVHRIVEGHGGSLDIDTTVGAGTCFRVRLPMDAPADGSATDGARAETPDAAQAPNSARTQREEPR